MKEPAKGRQPGRDSDPEAESPQSRHHQREEAEVEDRIAISAHVVYKAILAEGESELKRPTSALAFSGFAAGLSMGFSFLAVGLLQASLPERAWAPLVAKLGYPMGFLVVILGRQQLFTENTLTAVLPLLKDKTWATFVNVVRLWLTVLLANWLGTIAFAWVVAQPWAVANDARAALHHISLEAIQPGFLATMVKGIFAGWLIALLVWLLPFAETGRVAVIILMTYIIALGSFTHVVAGSVDAFYLVALGERNWGEYLGDFMWPTLLGNILGGVSLVSVLNHAQVTAGSSSP